jgi:hypothetical protein
LHARGTNATLRDLKKDLAMTQRPRSHVTRGARPAAPPSAWLRLVLLTLLLLCVQGLPAAGLACQDRCADAADCHPCGAGCEDGGKDDDGDATACSCPGCAAQPGGLALLERLCDLGVPAAGGGVIHLVESPHTHQLVRDIFHPPCA